MTPRGLVLLLGGLPARLRLRLSREGRRVLLRLRPLQSGMSRLLRRLPLPHGPRAFIYRYLVWRPGKRYVCPDDLLLGAQNGLLGSDFARVLGDLTWPSTPVGEGPHAALLM